MDTLEENNKDKYFKGQQKNESFVCFFRDHWITLLKEFVLFTIYLIIIVFFLLKIETIKELLRGNRELKLFFFTGFIIGTAYYHRFFLKILNYFVNIGIITDMRVIDHHKTLYFVDNIDSIDMAQIQNIEMKEEGLMPSLLKYGDIKIFLTASDTIKTFRKVPNAKFHFRCLSRQKEARQNTVFRERRTSSQINIAPQEYVQQQSPLSTLYQNYPSPPQQSQTPEIQQENIITEEKEPFNQVNV